MLSGFTASPMEVALSLEILFQLKLQLEMAALLLLLPKPLQRSTSLWALSVLNKFWSRQELVVVLYWQSFQIQSHVFPLQDILRNRSLEWFPTQIWSLLIGLPVVVMKVGKNGILNFIGAPTTYFLKAINLYFLTLYY